MSLTFKFDKVNENDSVNKDISSDSENQKDIQFYNKPSEIKKLHLINYDGKEICLNYSYLIAHEFLPDENSITLFFTSHSVILRGYNLKKLFEEFINHTPKRIKCVDERYKSIVDELNPCVTELNVKSI